MTMNPSRWAVLAGAGLVLAFLAGRVTGRMPMPAGKHVGPPGAPTEAKKDLYTCAMHPQILQDRPGECPICGTTLVPVRSLTKGPEASRATATPEGPRKILYWRAPMDPSYISDKPGKSPMGMDLVPVYEDELSSAEIRVSPAVIQNTGMTWAEALRGPLFKELRTYGTATWDESSLASLNTKVAGWIEKLEVNETGQKVRQGQPLVTLYSPQLVATQQEYLAALDASRSFGESPDPSVAAGGRDLLKAARQRLQLWDITDQQISELERTRKVSRSLVLYAQIDGIVTQRNVVVGDHVQAGMNLVKLARLDPIWVMASLYEEDIPFVHKGMKASVTFDDRPGEVREGVVDYVYPYVEGATRTTKARIRLPNLGGRIRPQSYAAVNLRVPVATHAVLIPENAVIRASATDSVVFIARGEGKFQGRKVTLGAGGEGGRVVVRAGLEPGERVVTSAQFLLDSESNLKAAIQSLLDPASRKAKP